MAKAWVVIAMDNETEQSYCWQGSGEREFDDAWTRFSRWLVIQVCGRERKGLIEAFMRLGVETYRALWADGKPLKFSDDERAWTFHVYVVDCVGSELKGA